MEIKKIDADFSICKVEDISQVNFADDFVFIGKTDDECSLVCNSKFTPKNALECDNGWKAFRIEGVPDFSLVGILAKIATLLAKNEISIFALSTFNTDYVLVKQENYNKALRILSDSCYSVESPAPHMSMTMSY